MDENLLKNKNNSFRCRECAKRNSICYCLKTAIIVLQIITLVFDIIGFCFFMSKLFYDKNEQKGI
jgi:hypothetical protein